MACAGDARQSARPCIFVLTYFVLIAFDFAFQVYALPPVPAPVLYSDKDNVLILNQSNYESSIFNKDRAFIIEFYNSYCGHCQRYAPVWIAFATDIKLWSPIVAPAVVDCSIPENLELCQNYEIPAYPTVKHFWTHLTANDHGVPTPHGDVASVRHNLLDFLTQNAQEKGIPNHWPMLLPVTHATLSGIWKGLPKEITSFYLVIEEANSYVGREVILDFTQTNARILRVEDTSSTQINDLPEISTYPALIILSRSAAPKLVLSATSVDEARKEFRSAIEDATGIVLEPSLHGKANQSQKNEDDQPSAKENRTLPVQMVDLEDALHNILLQEVPLNKELSGHKLVAFKSFLAALTKTFPGRVPVMRFLQNLYNWVLQQGPVVDSNDMRNFIKDSQAPDAYLPDMTDWVGCRGSSPKYRGYTCSLWTLFHTMTVQAYKNYLAGETSHPQQVLHAIHDYVYNFFGCSECAEHFHSMAINLDSEIHHPNDTILWLWRAHNIVNLRLKGDATEDPAHPKLLFPPKFLCRQCTKQSVAQRAVWDTPIVLRFLMSYYGRSQISQDGVVPFKTHVTRHRRTEINKFPSFGWNFR